MASLILKSVATVGQGPHDKEYPLPAHSGAPVAVRAESMAGKSTRPVLHYAALTGLNPEGKPWKAEQFRHLPSRLTATTAGGKALVREWRETKTGIVQTIRLDGKAIEQAALAKLVGLYTDPMIAGAVLIPGAWQGALRDLLLQTAGRTRAESQRQTDALCLGLVQASPDWCAGDAETIAGASKARLDTQKSCNVSEGELTAAERATEQAQKPLEVVGEAELNEARAVLQAQEAWEEYSHQLAAYRLWARYLQAVADLGTEPADVSAELATANARRDTAAAAYRVALQNNLTAEGMATDAAKREPPAEPRDLSLLLLQIADLENGPVDDVCPTCLRPGALDAIAAKLRDLRDRAAPLDEAYRASAAAWQVEADNTARGAIQSAEIASRSLDAALAEGKEAKADLDRLTAESKARSTWLEGRNRLTKPVEVAKPEPMEQPDPEGVAFARRIVEAGPVDESRAAEREARISACVQTEEKAGAAFRALGLEVARLVRLEAAWKAAPAGLLPAAVERFNSLLTPAVRVVLDEGNPVVTVHGRAVSTYGQTSGGEGVLADVAIRAGLRDLYGLLLPIYADEANRWSTAKNKGKSDALTLDWAETGIAGLCLLATP